MELNKDDYCEDCWKIVSSENEGLKTEEGVASSPAESPGANGDPTKTTTVNTIGDQAAAEKPLTKLATVVDDPVKRSSTVKSMSETNAAEKPLTKLSTVHDDSVKRSSTVKTVSKLDPPGRSVTVKSVDDKSQLRTRLERTSGSITSLTGTAIGSAYKVRSYDVPQKTKAGINFNDDIKSTRTLGGVSQKSSKHTAQSAWSIPSILPSQSVILEGARPNDSDLCLDCLVREHHHSFEKNILQNVYGSVEEPHECRMVPVQKRGQGKYIQVCNDVDCPRYKFWRIIEAGGSGWRVDDSFEGCLPPPPEFGGSSCFLTSDGLCSKEQLVELAEVGLTPRIMDEVKPDIEVSEWFCGRGDCISRYGFKVSLLDSKQLMMNVYGECKTLEPPDSPKWRKVTYKFQDYDAGVRYVLFHHGGTGECFRGLCPEGEGETHPGSKMAGASVRVRLPGRHSTVTRPSTVSRHGTVTRPSTMSQHDTVTRPSTMSRHDTVTRPSTMSRHGTVTRPSKMSRHGTV